MPHDIIINKVIIMYSNFPIKAITRIINIMLQTGTCPRNLNHLIIQETGDKQKVRNYKPTALLNFVLINCKRNNRNQSNELLDKHNISKARYEFLNNKSQLDAISDVVDSMSNELIAGFC